MIDLSNFMTIEHLTWKWVFCFTFIMYFRGILVLGEFNPTVRSSASTVYSIDCGRQEGLTIWQFLLLLLHTTSSELNIFMYVMVWETAARSWRSFVIALNGRRTFLHLCNTKSPCNLMSALIKPWVRNYQISERYSFMPTSQFWRQLDHDISRAVSE